MSTEPGKCGTCKHWGKANENDNAFRSCQAIAHDKLFLSKEQASHLWEQEDIEALDSFTKEHKAVVTDGSGFKAALRSRSDFGCVLYSPREGA